MPVTDRMDGLVGWETTPSSDHSKDYWSPTAQVGWWRQRAGPIEDGVSPGIGARKTKVRGG